MHILILKKPHKQLACRNYNTGGLGVEEYEIRGFISTRWAGGHEIFEIIVAEGNLFLQSPNHDPFDLWPTKWANRMRQALSLSDNEAVAFLTKNGAESVRFK